MDPISLHKLLSVVDLLDQAGQNTFTLEEFQKIVGQVSRAKRLRRRSLDILRVLTKMSLLARPDQDCIEITSQFHRFLNAWNVGDAKHLEQMGEILALYQPFQRFLHALKEMKTIRIPVKDQNAKTILGRFLYENYQITFVAFDTFRYWAIATGYAYLSPFNDTLYWGRNHPTLPEFRDSCWKAYTQSSQTSGYTNIGWVADAVCRALYIGFPTFERLFEELCRLEDDKLRIAPATIREPSRRYQILVLRPREEVLRERLKASALGDKSITEPRWLIRRFLEDGVFIGPQRVKLMRWEVAG